MLETAVRRLENVAEIEADVSAKIKVKASNGKTRVLSKRTFLFTSTEVVVFDSFASAYCHSLSASGSIELLLNSKAEWLSCGFLISSDNRK